MIPVGEKYFIENEKAEEREGVRLDFVLFGL